MDIYNLVGFFGIFIAWLLSRDRASPDKIYSLNCGSFEIYFSGSFSNVSLHPAQQK